VAVAVEAFDCGRMANHGHCGAEAYDCGRRTFIPVWVRQDTTVRMANHGYDHAARRPCARPQSALFTMRPQSQAVERPLSATRRRPPGRCAGDHHSRILMDDRRSVFTERREGWSAPGAPVLSDTERRGGPRRFSICGGREMVHCERKLIPLNDHQRMAQLPKGGGVGAASGMALGDEWALAPRRN
jgi:hypothetical protein